MLLARDGYWTFTNVKVCLTKAEKVQIDRASSPRWEIDVVAYSGNRNLLLAVECKSLLDSPGVVFRNGAFERARRYKLFMNPKIRRVVLRRLRKQLVKSGACAPKCRVQLCLAAGHIASKSDREGMTTHFKKHGWLLFDDAWILDRLRRAAESGYENDMAHIVAKLLVPKGTL